MHSRKFQTYVFYLVIGLSLIPEKCLSAELHRIDVIERTLYGPGPFPDQTLKDAWISNIELSGFLTGITRAVNNGGEEPNVSGEILQGKIIDGKLSDGTLINENIDMSNAEIMNGQFNLLLAAVYGGPNEGNTYFYTDDNLSWWIKDDIAIDPGFSAGIVNINDFTFTTGPRLIPRSIQSESGYPGGTSQTGSLETGRLAIGALGDSDEDGYLDGIFNAIGRFPMESIFLPGAPFVQLFKFTSDIPITPLEDAALTLASTRLYYEMLKTELHKEDVKKIKVILNNNRTRLNQEKYRTSLRDCIECDSESYWPKMIKFLETGTSEEDHFNIFIGRLTNFLRTKNV